jgi:phenylpyruvate tautomerase PptA (4-oxalocrotonate tautomerase family)
MPLLDLTFPAGALSPDVRDTLADDLAAALLRAERAPDTEFFRTITWAYLHELPDEHVRANGKPAQNFRLQATVPQGALSDRRKQEFVEAATRIVREAAVIPEEEVLRVWVLINEVPEGNWGAAGGIVRFENLKAAAAHEQEQEQAAV